MDKKVIIAFALALLVIVFYPRYLKKVTPEQPAQQSVIAQEETIQEEAYQPATEDTTLTSEVISEPIAEQIVEPKIPEEDLTIDTNLMEITFSSYGGTIKSLRLFEYLDEEDNPVGLIIPLSPEFRPIATNLLDSDIPYSIRKEDNKVICSASSKDLKVTKIYTFHQDSYLIGLNIILKNIGSKNINLPSYTIRVGSIFPGNETQANLYIGTTNLIDGKAAKNKLGKQGYETLRTGKIFWSGLKNKYFAFILKPQTHSKKVHISEVLSSTNRGITSKITQPEVSIHPGRRVEETFLIYAGPKKYEILKSLEAELYQIMDFGILAPISKIMLNILNFLYGIVHNYGFAIILLTILVKIVLYPLTLKSYKSMREMHKLQPLIQELQKKYKEDPKRMQKEMMLLYREHKVNPISGCFPMLLQMPILIALFTTLRSAIELRGAPFILWIKDLSEPDTIARLPNGFPINVLPIILLAAFFVQQKMTAMPATTEQQKQQQKMMGYMMPLFMGFIFYRMPSGLVLYFSLSTILGILDQYRIQKSKS